MRFWLSMLLVGWSAGASAQQANCANPQTQTDMNICAAEAYQEADARLNAAWRQLKPQFDSVGAGAALLDSQRKWLAYRDSACAVETGQYRGGSIASLIMSSCLRVLTDRRTNDLNALRN